jgi:hypothetical protein
MSDKGAQTLDLQGEIARIDLARQETRRSVEEQHKPIARGVRRGRNDVPIPRWLVVLMVAGAAGNTLAGAVTILCWAGMIH